MAEKTVQKDHGPRKRLTKAQAVSTMVVGGAMLVLVWFIPAEQGSSLQMVKVGIGLLGFLVVCLGSYYRP
jgi:hypothetical protein